MTVKELKDYYFKFLKITLKPKISVSDDYEVTEEDIESGRIFQKYIPSDTLTKIVNGFAVIEHKIYYVYTKLHRIEILADDFFPPCGGESEIMVNAVYAVRGLSTFNFDTLLSGKDSYLCPVNALVKIDNPLFTYEKPYLINYEPNNTEENKVVNVSASYYYKGTKYEASKTITQNINTNSSWLVEEEPTQSITLTLSENVVSNKGGIVLAKVEREFTRAYYKKDSCGNKIAEKEETGLTEDITKKCLITSSNKKQFSVSKNIITLSKQDIGALQRECTITARYMEYTDSAVIVQKEGGKITYTQELTFPDGNKTSFVDFETSLPIERKIPIISKEYKYIDGEYVSASNTNEIKIESDSDWVYGVPGEDEKGVNVDVRITATNFDKYNDKEATLTITSTINPDLVIKLIVSQQALEIVKEDYYCVFISDGEYTSEEIDKEELFFHPYKILTYEDGETEETNIEDYITFKYASKSGDEGRLNVSAITKRGEDYYVSFNNLSAYSMKDIIVNIKLMFYDQHGERLFESDKASIVVKGNQIVDYDYELCFNGHNKFEEIEWVNSTAPKYIKVNSLKHKLVNGKYAGKEQIPYKVGIYDEKGKEYFDNTFSIKIANDEILVFPVKTSKNVNKTYTITQKESGLQTSFKLSYKVKKSTVKVPLKVIVYSNSIGKDVWTGENGYLLIDGNESIKLNPCWLSPTMKDNVDTAYDGVIELEEGTHTFETFNVLCLEFASKTHRDCNIYNEIKVDKTTKNIILQIKV